MSKRKGFNFYISYYDVFKQLNTDKDKVAFINALLERQFEGTEPTSLKGMAQFAYVSQKHSIDAQIKGWEDKTKTKLTPPTEGGTEGGLNTPTQQVQEKGKEEVQVKEKEEEQEQQEGLIFPFEDFWLFYDKKVGNKEAIKKKFEKLSDDDKQQIINTLPAYKESTPEKQYRQNPETYINQKTWNSEIIIKSNNNGQSTDTRTHEQRTVDIYKKMGNFNADNF